MVIFVASHIHVIINIITRTERTQQFAFKKCSRTTKFKFLPLVRPHNHGELWAWRVSELWLNVGVSYLSHLCAPPNIIKLIRGRKTRWDKHVACILTLRFKNRC